MTTRREALAAIASFGVSSELSAIPAHHMAVYMEVAHGLQAPEGPKALPDGSVLVCEMARGTLSRVWPDGHTEVAAELGGSPNGEAIGPDGAVYVVNNGGMTFNRSGDLLEPLPSSKERSGGSLQRVELESGKISTLYSEALGHPIRAPNDIVFDHRGDCWFTDPGIINEGAVRGGVFWAKPDGSKLRQVLALSSPNGIALSPNGNTLYVALTGSRTVVACEIEGSGTLSTHPDGQPRVRSIMTLDNSNAMFDSMAVEADGTLVVGTLFAGCLSLIYPDGRVRDQLYFPEKFVTNIAFGGADLRSAFITLTTTGRLVKVHWPRPGLRLAFQEY